jgi:hypothetical protein
MGDDPIINNIGALKEQKLSTTRQISVPKHRGDRGYIGHFLVFPLLNVVKDEFRKKYMSDSLSFIYVCYLFISFFVKLLDSY